MANMSSASSAVSVFVLVICCFCSTMVSCQKTACGLYGQPPCTFVPVPKGATPPCAGLRKTYCEHVPNYPKTQIRNIIRKLQYDIKVHLVDEVPLEFTDMHPVPRPDTKYGVPPVVSNNNNNNNNKKNNLHPPSPTYGVPGLEPGSPSIRIGSSFPNQYEQPLPTVFLSTPAPTYGVPKNAYIPPINNFQVNPSAQSPNYFTANRVPTGSSEGGGAGYVYNKPSANLRASAQLQVKRVENEDSSKSDEEEEGSVRNIEFTTESPREPPAFFFSEQFEPTPPPALVTSSLPIVEQQQQHVFHPEEQPFLPNSPPAPFSTAVYQERSLKLQQEQLEPLPTLASDTQPPSPQARNFYRTDSQVAQSITNYNQAEWFRRISRSLANVSQVVEVKKQQQAGQNDTFLSELRGKKEMLQILFPEHVDEEDAEIDEDLIINFKAAHALAGNRTSRTKRQSIYTNRLCETTTQFIEPQAALTRDGEWKFIVNQVESARQLVRVEYCASTTCSNLCILPNGYTSSCEQKYVQKRLVTLDASGTNIYTDTFWFPSCCVCTLSNPAN